jgi:hypothetical protein
MASNLTLEQIADLRRLEAAATQGEWHVNRGSNGAFFIIADHLPGWRALIDNDNEFIAAFRNAAPALLDAAEETARLRKIEAAARKVSSGLPSGGPWGALNELRATLEAKP